MSAEIDQTVFLLLAMVNLERILVDQIPWAVLKFLSGGGFGLWWFIDMLRYINAALMETTAIPCTNLYRFDPKSLSLGFYVSILLLIIIVIPLFTGPLLVHRTYYYGRNNYITQDEVVVF
jgi:hypothetical protein